MKRLFAVLFTTLLLSAALGATASASNFDTVAEELSTIGVFRGTGTGFELDRAPTRAEAAIMLVRLYGAEEEAGAAYAAGNIHHPFTDVPDFAAPYIAWLYERGLTNGTSPTTFSSSANCTAENYLAFMVRSLGYQDGTDFQYADVVSFAESKGLLDTSVLSGTFLRDDLASLTYQALSCDLKDSSTYLLDSLIKDGAISADAARPITEKIELYRMLLDSSADTDQNLDVDYTIKANVAVTAEGVSNGQPVSDRQEVPMDCSGRIQMILDKDPQMAMTMKGTVAGEPVDGSFWLKDGWMYTQVEGESYKVNLGDEINTMMQDYQDILAVSGNQLSAMLPFIDTITVSTSGQDDTIHVTFNDAFSGLMDSIVELVMGSIDDASMEGLDMDIHLNQCSYAYTLDDSGHVKNISASIGMGMAFTMNMDSQNNITVSTDMDMDMDMIINAVGSSVVISYPDFSGFVEQTGTGLPK